MNHMKSINKIGKKEKCSMNITNTIKVLVLAPKTIKI